MLFLCLVFATNLVTISPTRTILNYNVIYCNLLSQKSLTFFLVGARKVDVAMFDRIKKLAEKRSMNLKELALTLGLSQNFFYRLKNGASMSSENLKKVADYFDVSTDYLLGRENLSDEQLEQQRLNVEELLKQNKIKLMYDNLELNETDKEQLERVIRAVLWERIEKL